MAVGSIRRLLLFGTGNDGGLECLDGGGGGYGRKLVDSGVIWEAEWTELAKKSR